MWANFFDKIYVINLAKRTDRMEQAKNQLDKYNIPFERFEAIEDVNGAEGLRLTMIEIFTNAIRSNYKNILLLEDDLDVIQPEINSIMDNVVKDIPSNYDIIYLGCQLCRTPSEWYNENLLRVQSAFATHAAMYSLQAMKKILERNFFSPVDNCICQYVQPENLCFAIYPILISQIPSKSDIYKDQECMDWRKYLQDKYWIQIAKMKINGHFHPNAKNYDNG